MSLCVLFWLWNREPLRLRTNSISSCTWNWNMLKVDLYCCHFLFYYFSGRSFFLSVFRQIFIVCHISHHFLTEYKCIWCWNNNKRFELQQKTDVPSQCQWCITILFVAEKNWFSSALPWSTVEICIWNMIFSIIRRWHCRRGVQLRKKMKSNNYFCRRRQFSSMRG